MCWAERNLHMHHSTTAPTATLQAGLFYPGKAPTLETLVEAIETDFVMVPKSAVPVLGGAAPTLGAIIRLSDGGQIPVFHTRETIAEMACRWLKNIDRDLDKLAEHGYIYCHGRERSNRGRKRRRRTNTYLLTDKTKRALRQYWQIPRPALWLQTWAMRAVYAAIVDRHLIIKRHCIEYNHGREEYSLNRLAEHTGLSQRNVLRAKNRLVDGGLIIREGTKIEHENGTERYLTNSYYLAGLPED